MANFRFDDLMKDLGLPSGHSGEPVKTDSDDTSEQTSRTMRPDMSGSGLGEASAPLPRADLAPIRPDDALSELWTPEASEGQSGDLSSIVIERGHITSEQLESARRMERQTPGRSMAALMVDSGGDESGIQSVVAELARPDRRSRQVRPQMAFRVFARGRVQHAEGTPS